MLRPLLASLALALASVLAPMPGASASRASEPAGGDGDGRAHDAGTHGPSWIDPGARGRLASSGEAPRVLPRTTTRHAPRTTGARHRGRRRGDHLLRPDLNRLGRRQTDGG